MLDRNKLEFFEVDKLIFTGPGKFCIELKAEKPKT